ncbi:unnamed protein product, partial [Staurois parvus]
RASGHQASGHFLARQQRAPRHLARQWLSGQSGMTVWLDSRTLGSPCMTAGTGSPGIRSFGLTAGTRVIWQGSGQTGQPGIDRLAHSGAIGSPGIRSFGSPSGHRVIWQGSGTESTRYDSGL